MDRIDRLGWAAGICLIAYGRRIGIRVNRPELLNEIAGSLPPQWRPATGLFVDRLYSLREAGPSPRSNLRLYHLLYAGPGRIARSLRFEDLLDALESDLQFYLAVMARQKLFVHAGVVAWKDRALVLPGRSCAGKTTLVAELVRAGAQYYSDEFALLDARGRVHPYPKPLAIRDQLDGKPRKQPVETLGGSAGTKPLPVGWVVVTRFKSGAAWRPQRLSIGQGVLELLNHCACARIEPKMAVNRFSQALGGAQIRKCFRGEAREIARILLAQL